MSIVTEVVSKRIPSQRQKFKKCFRVAKVISGSVTAERQNCQ